MPGYDFLDPNQINEYKQKALEGGVAPSAIDKYVNIQQRKQAQQQKLEMGQMKMGLDTMKMQKEMMQLSGLVPEEASQSVKDKQRFADMALNTVGLMENIYGQEDLTVGRGVLGKVQLGAEAAKEAVTGSSKKRSKQREFQQVANILVSQLSQAFGSGTPQEGEAQRLIESMPGRTSTDEEAQNWFNNVRYLLGQAAGKDPEMPMGQAPQGLDPYGAPQQTQVLQPAYNIEGGKAQPGDLVKDRQSGVVYKYGEDLQEPTVLKKAKDNDKIEVDNKLVQFLANSEFLPIAGSIVGGLLGGGLGSIATGAAGAMAGKGMKQGLIELLDPDRADMGTHARVIMTEGLTDAVFSGLTMGVAPLAKGGVKLILRGGGEVAEAAVKEGTEAVVKEGVQRVAGETTESMAKKALPVLGSQEDIVRKQLTPAVTESLAEKTEKFNMGKDPIALIVEKFNDKLGQFTSPKESIKVGQEAMQESGVRISQMLEGKTLEAKPIIDEIETMLKSLERKKLSTTGEMTEEAMQKYASGITRIQEDILPTLRASAKEGGGKIDATELHNLKLELGDVFSGRADIEQGSKSILRETRGILNKNLRAEFPDYKNQNGVYRAGELLVELSEKTQRKLTRDQYKQALKFNDMLVGSAGFAGGGPIGAITTVGIKKGLDILTKDPYLQMSILTKMLNMSASLNNKVAARSILRTIQSMDYPVEFGVSESLMKGALRTGTNITQSALSDLKGEEIDPGPTQSPETMQGMEMGQPQPGLSPADLGSGGGLRQGIELGAYTQEGVPLYR